MIAFIEGDLVECQLNLAVIQVGGIGYEVHIPLTTSEKLPSLGKEVKLFNRLRRKYGEAPEALLEEEARPPLTSV